MKRLLICLLLFVNLLSCKAQDYIDWVSPAGGYGALYNWYAASNASFAPVGWHVATNIDFNTLQTTIGGSSYGGALKEMGYVHWKSPNTNATNEVEFCALGSGIRAGNGEYSLLLENCYLATSIDNGGLYYGRYLNYSSGNFYISNTGSLKSGWSVRIIKDDSTDPGTLTDYDGNVYQTIKIGNQVWIASNWKCTHLNDGTLIPNVTDNSAWAALTTMGMCYYNNDIKNK